jgi:hypothetical protein
VAQGKEWQEGIRPGVEECKPRQSVRRLKRPKVSYREAQKLPRSEMDRADAELAD